MIQRFACLSLLVAIIGCRQNPPTEKSPDNGSAENRAAGTANCKIERSLEGEQILRQLRHNAWVFRHSGGPLNPEFNVFHKPTGKDTTEKEVFHATGSQTLHMLYSRDESERETNDKNGGFIIVTFPDNWTNADEQLLLTFSLNGASSSISATKDVFGASEESGDPTYTSISGGPITKPITLAPGESHVLADTTIRPTNDSETPTDEREAFRYVLTVTALTEGELANPQP